MSATQDVEVVETDDIDMETLIMFVEERPLLWDKSLEEYKDRLKNREASKAMGESKTAYFFFFFAVSIASKWLALSSSTITFQ